ncbi:MAG TPA: ATP-binding protein [Microvirga sp.]|jgi:signal transduction histidine kinase/ActR/RegA family two-component response regulator|nr:ATP-binding protein [Microvirga sp.]
MTAWPAAQKHPAWAALWDKPFAVQRQAVLGILTAAGAVCTIALWVFETATGLIAEHDRYGYPFLVAVFTAGLFIGRAPARLRIPLELACYTGVALYFVAALFTFVILQNDGSIYIIANTLQWMPLVYVAAFVFFEQREAILAGAGVFVVSLVPALAVTAVKGAGFWSVTVAALLINAYVIHALTLVALSLFVVLHERLKQVKQALAERDEALVDLRREAAERLRLEEQLRQSQRMEAVGQLTGGIAHDFNNLLTVILGNAEALMEGPCDPERVAGLSGYIVDAAERGADLTQKLLAFGRRQSLRPERIALPDVVDRILPLLRRTLGEPIDVHVEASCGLVWALADRSLLESSLLNLALNARDAMPQGGTLTIRTGQRTAGPDEGDIPIGQDVVFVEVSDTGVGMPSDVVARVFEPFFTTKEVGKGTGLGLSMVYGFAQQSGGHVGIRTQPGRGTTVTVLLRAVSPDLPPDARRHLPAALPTGTERVLLVEDDPQVLQSVSSQLLDLGYRVTAVADGLDALNLLRQDQPFDLLFTDLVMPKGMSGVDLARHARDLRPGIKVLLTSGYAEETFARHGRPDEGMQMLRKPYRRQDLAAMLRRVLSEDG